MVAHRHEAVEAAGGIKCHTNHDQQAGTAQLDAHTGQVAQNDRQHSHRSQEDGTDEGDLVQGAGDEIAGRLAGTEAGDRAVVAAQIVGLYVMQCVAIFVCLGVKVSDDVFGKTNKNRYRGQ